MSEISEAAMAKARELAKQAGVGKGASSTDGRFYSDVFDALASFIQQVSDAANAATAATSNTRCREELAPFILPDPLLMEAREVAAANWDQHYASDVLEGTYDASPVVVAALAGLKRGLEIREIGK